MRFLITGVAGHLGSRLAQFIIDQGGEHEIVGIDDLSCGYPQNVPNGVKLYIREADDTTVFNDFGPFDAVFHFAAYAAECMSPFVRRYNYRNNLMTTAGLISNLIDADFHGRLVFTSSIAAYGDANGAKPPFSEPMACRPHDPYGVAKLACEQDIAIAGRQHGIDWCVVRPHNIFGPFQSIWQKHRNVIGLWMRAVLEGKPIVIFGDGEQRRAFSYIDDVIPALWKCYEWDSASERVINVGGSQPVTINELAQAFARVVGPGNIRREPARHEVRDAWCTTRLSEELLQYRDTVSLEEGIGRMWRWAQKAWAEYPERRDQPADFDIETSRGMPPSWLPQASLELTADSKTA